MKICELILIKRLSSEKAAEILVMDGTLQATGACERDIINNFFDKCVQNNLIACSISKTNSMTTEKGFSIGAALMKISE